MNAQMWVSRVIDHHWIAALEVDESTIMKAYSLRSSVLRKEKQ